MRYLTEEEKDGYFIDFLVLAKAVETTLGELAAYCTGTPIEEKDNQCFVGIFQNMPNLYNRKVICWFSENVSWRNFPFINGECYIECNEKEAMEIQLLALKFNGVLTPILCYADGLYKFTTYTKHYEIDDEPENTFEKNQIVIALDGYGPPRDEYNNNVFLYLGEIPNMRGHCAVVDRNGKTHWGWHIENFRHPTEDEI